MVVTIIITLIVVILISIMWVIGVDNMKNKYPDYKGEDWLDWDENKNHTEGDF